MNVFGNLINDFLGISNGIVTLSCDNSSIVLPVTPESFGVQVKNNNSVVNITNFGNYNMMGKTGLKSITISSFFPAQDYNFSSGGDEPYELVNQIEEWRLSTKPLNLLIENSTIDFDCLIDSFEYKEQDGTGDVYFTLVLTEYRNIQESLPSDKLTGLKGRKSALQKAIVDVSISISKGMSPMKAVKKAVKNSVKKSGAGYLSDYKKIIKNGGINPGDILKITSKSISINNKMI